MKPGFYVYVGSAFGPGGVQARVGRHFRKAKRHRWHIDYLRAAVEPVGAWCSFVPNRLEHDWATAFNRVEDACCIPGFGCSDCSCGSHLFAMPRMPDNAEVFAVGVGPAEFWDYGAAGERGH